MRAQELQLIVDELNKLIQSELANVQRGKNTGSEQKYWDRIETLKEAKKVIIALFIGSTSV